MSDLQRRIVNRVVKTDDAELRQKLLELLHARNESLPKLRRGASGKPEVDPHSLVAIMRGEAKASTARANELCADIAADVSLYGERETGVAEWLFAHCSDVVKEIGTIESELQDEQRIGWKVLIAATIVMALLLLSAYLALSGSYSLAFTVFAFLVVLLVASRIYMKWRVNRRRRIYGEIRKFLKQASSLIEVGSYDAAKSHVDAAYALARGKGIWPEAPWTYYYYVRGQTLLGLNQIETAQNSLQEALELARIRKDNTAEFAALSGLANCCQAKGDDLQALALLQSAREVAKRDGFPEFVERDHNMAAFKTDRGL